MQSQSLDQDPINPESQEEDPKALAPWCIVTSAETLEDIKFDESLRYKCIFVVNRLLEAHPNLLSPELLCQFTLTSLKVILNNLPLQHAEVSPELQADLNAIPSDYLQEIEQVFSQVMSSLPPINQTPYSILKGIKAEFQMNDITYTGIKYILSYALTFTETYTSSPDDVLHACITLYASTHPWTLVYLLGLGDKVTGNAETLRELFTMGYQQDLNP